MADRYQGRPFPADDDDHGVDPHAAGAGESDPLAELARLIGQTDPFGSMGRANQPVPPRPAARETYQHQPEPDVAPPAGPPPWLQRANRQEVPQQQEPPDYPSSVHPLQRYAAARPAAEPEYQDYQEVQPYAAEAEADPARYDDALYGQVDTGDQPYQPDPAYADDAYGYQDGYDEGAEAEVPKRRGGMVTVAVVLALAVVGTGAAFAYRTYVGSPRSGEPPIIKADTSPTKIVPAPADGTGKVPDRMTANDGAEKIVPREEAPVDVNTGPRVVLPPLNQNANPPSVASVSPNQPPASGGNGTMPNSEPRKIRTLTVRGDQPDSTAMPVTSPAPAAAKPAPAPRAAAMPSPAAAPAPAAPRNPPTSANASANAPLSLVPQGTQPAPAAEPRTRVANTSPAQTAPSAGGGGYLVQVSSQKSEADAQASYRALQGKYPGVLGSQASVVKRVDLGEKGVYYRAFAGPFSSADQATQVCSNLKAAGGPQCLIQRN
jgi:hypothetical protein